MRSGRGRPGNKAITLIARLDLVHAHACKQDFMKAREGAGCIIWVLRI